MLYLFRSNYIFLTTFVTAHINIRVIGLLILVIERTDKWVQSLGCSLVEYSSV